MDSDWRSWTASLGIVAGILVGAECQAATPSAGRTPGVAVTARQVNHIEFDGALDASFSTGTDASGNAVMMMSAADLVLQKTVSPTGAATMRLTNGKDVVSVTIGRRGYTVARGKRSASFNPATPRDGDRESVREVLLGSKAVRAFREFTAILEERQGDDTAIVLATLLDGAVVDMLDGDPGAVDRIARRVTAKRRTGAHPAQFRLAQFEDCVLSYELSLLYSYDLYWTCLQTAENSPWYIWYIARSMCEWEFLIRSQQYVFQMVSCVAIPV
jgi:hypothetical protein